jgi:hypothetical protein
MTPSWSCRSSRRRSIEPMSPPAGWMRALTAGSPMKSPGAPALWRDVERLFWREIANGLTNEEAGGRRVAGGLAAGSGSVAGCRCSWFPPWRAGICRPGVGGDRHGERPGCRGEGDRSPAGRDPSTISRALRRDAATRGGKLDYRASVAHWKAERCVVPRRRSWSPRSTARVRAGMAFGPGSPPGRRAGAGAGSGSVEGAQQAPSPGPAMDQRLTDFPDDDSTRISHEAIYQALFI